MSGFAMKNPSPCVGIALAAFRPNIEYFRAQLQSIQAQSHVNWKCVITLDSPLVEVRCRKELDPFFADDRFVWLENSHRLGHKLNFEYAIQQTLRWDPWAVACCDQDDVWHSNKLSRQLEVLSELPKFSLVHCDMNLLAPSIGENHQRLFEVSKLGVWALEKRQVENHSADELLMRNVVAGTAMMMDASLAREYPNIPQEFEYHDHWYALCAEIRGQLVAVPDRLFDYRQHDQNVVGATNYEPFLAYIYKQGARGLAKKAKKSFLENRSRVLAINKVFPGVKINSNLLFLSKMDFGIGLLLFGLWALLRRDRVLARVSMGRSFGKLVWLFTGGLAR